MRTTWGPALLAPVVVSGRATAQEGDVPVITGATGIVCDGAVVPPRTKLTRKWIRGKPVELTSRQSELADRCR